MNEKLLNRSTAVLLLLLLGLAISSTFGSSFTVGPNYRNVSVDTTVNITQSLPEVLQVIIDNGNDNITLNAGLTYRVLCNATVRDYNGAGTIDNVTAVFYDNQSVGYSAADDNNTHYTNMSCSQTAVDGINANYTCGFDVLYYANASAEWVCNVTANDAYDFNGSDFGFNYNVTEIASLYALNVTALIDYGELAVGDTSGAEEANITNYGNQPINVSVYGYGATPGDNLAMVCDVGSISVGSQKYSLNATADFTTEYATLSGSPGTQIANLTIDREIVDNTQVINTTYWRLTVPPNPFGRCNGTVVFQAEVAN